MIFGWPTSTPPFPINFKCQVESQVSDYRLIGASSFNLVYILMVIFCLGLLLYIINNH
jgi:hypothetical protein